MPVDRSSRTRDGYSSLRRQAPGVFPVEVRLSANKDYKKQIVVVGGPGRGATIVEVAPENKRLLYFCGFAGRFSITSMSWDRPPRRFCHYLGCRVLNSVAAGRRLARRTVLLQAVATLLAALVCLSFGAQAALGGLVGGAAMTLGSALTAWGAFSGGVVGAGAAFGRLLLGLAAKWIVVIAGLLLAIAVWKLPAPPVLVGAAMAAAALLFTARDGLRRE